MKIVIVSPGMEHDGNTLKKQSLGGSETAAIQVAEEFAKLKSWGTKNEVTVFSQCKEPVKVNEVRYFPLQMAGEYLMGVETDLLIVSRFTEFLNRPYNTKLTYFWCHDLALKRMMGQVKGSSWSYDKILLMSEFQKEQYKKVYDFPDGFHYVIRNGIDLSLFPEVKPIEEREMGRIMYCARPERGLENLVRPGGIMEKLIQRGMGEKIRLQVAGYDNTTQEMAEYYNYLWGRLRALPNCEHLGSLTKKDLYDKYNKSWLYAYPTSFEEISCITMMENFATGLPVLTSAWGALPETVGDKAGILLEHPEEGYSMRDDYQDKFVDTLIEIYNNPDMWQEMHKAADERKVMFEWGPVAEDIQEEAERDILLRSGNKKALFKQFWYYSDIEACDRLWKVMNEEEREFCFGMKNHIDREFSFRESDIAMKEQYEKVGNTTTMSSYEGMGNEPRWLTMKALILEHKEALKGKKLLDFGCAYGHQTIRIANMLPDTEVVGVDLSGKALGFGKKLCEKHLQHGNLRFVEGDETTFDETGFSFVNLGEILEHVRDVDRLMAKAEKWAVQGGVIYITVPSGPWEFASYDSYPYRCHIRNFERRDLLDMFGGKKKLSLNYKALSTGENKNPLGHHYVIYENDIERGTGKINWKRKLECQAPPETISLCMIVKNAESMLHRTMKSVRPYVDEIIVCDTGSTDSTIEIAKQYGAKVLNAPSPVDSQSNGTQGIGFDAARNISISDAKGDWILWIDSDEELLHGGRLGKYTRAREVDGYGIAQHHLCVDPPVAMKPDLPVRLFRNNRGIKFFGVCHEHPETGINEGVGNALLMADVFIAHDGYLTEAVRRDRFLRNISLVVRDRQKYPERKLGKFLWLRDLIHLCRYRMEINGGRADEDVRNWASEAVNLFHEEYIDNIAMAFDPMLVDAVGYYSEANNMLNQGHVVKFTYGFNNGQENQLTGRFVDAEKAKIFIGGLMEFNLKQFEEKYW